MIKLIQPLIFGDKWEKDGDVFILKTTSHGDDAELQVSSEGISLEDLEGNIFIWTRGDNPTILMNHFETYLDFDSDQRCDLFEDCFRLMTYEQP